MKMMKLNIFSSDSYIYNFAVKSFLLIGFIFIFTSSTLSQSTDAKLLELRKQFAVNYLKPEAHFALAKYYHEKGDKLQAFFIMEYARRYRFSANDFDAAFLQSFGDNSAEQSVKAKETFENGFDLVKQNKVDEAEKLLIEAAKLAPKSAFIQGWIGRFYFKTKTNNAKALEYYFNAYFLDPHAYETEYVESRIRNIALENAKTRFEELSKSGKTLAEIASSENPLIVGQAIDAMAKQWKPEYSKTLLKTIENDDSFVRWFAFETLLKNAGSSMNELILTLSNDEDLRKQGLAAYALIEIKKEKSFETLRKMLTDKAELIRFDAASALALKGGETGLEILRAHQKIETNPLLKELLTQRLQEK